MTTVQSNSELQTAFLRKTDCIKVPNQEVGNPLLLAGRVQEGHFPIAILKRLTHGGNCKVSVGEGVVIPVNQTLATETMELLDELDEQKIELDVEDAKSVKVNLYYGS
jgi:hypothetical protein